MKKIFAVVLLSMVLPLAITGCHMSGSIGESINKVDMS